MFSLRMILVVVLSAFLLGQVAQVWSFNDEYYMYQTGHIWAEVEPVYNQGYMGDPETGVAIIGSGYDPGHIYENPWYKIFLWDYINQGPIPVDGYFMGQCLLHPFMQTNNSFGIAGVAPETGVSIMKVLDDYGFLPDWRYAFSAVNDAVYYAEAKIILLPFGSTSLNESIGRIIDMVDEEDRLLVCASGFSPYIPTYPARCDTSDNILSVGAHDERGEIAYYSPNSEIYAFGGQTLNYRDWGIQEDCVVAATPVNMTPAMEYQGIETEFWGASGPDMAAAYVASIAALVWATNPNLTAKEVSDILKGRANWVEEPEHRYWSAVTAKAVYWADFSEPIDCGMWGRHPNVTPYVTMGHEYAWDFTGRDETIIDNSVVVGESVHLSIPMVEEKDTYTFRYFIEAGDPYPRVGMIKVGGELVHTYLLMNKGEFYEGAVEIPAELLQDGRMDVEIYCPQGFISMLLGELDLNPTDVQNLYRIPYNWVALGWFDID